MTRQSTPKHCPKCGAAGRVIEARPRDGYIYRRHQCRSCGHTWPSYQSAINPKPAIASRRKRNR